ncbi:MAG: tetratricopeptide repeat protein [Lachnospira sp.]|nr:tetratricopeptide repeat protein [Lachnospira sp.]
MEKKRLWVLIIPVIFVIIVAAICLKTGELPLKIVGKIIKLTATCLAVAFGVSVAKPKDRYKQYADAYKDIIGDAFARSRSNYNKLMKAITFYNDNKHDKSIKTLEKLLSKCTTVREKSAVLTFMGLNYSDIKQYNSAIQCYEALLEEDPDNSRAWSNMGFSYWQIGRTDMAAESYCNAIDADPNNAYAYNNMANFWFRCGEFEDAIYYGERALEINNRLYQAMSAIALSYAHLGDEENAMKYGRMYLAYGGEGKDILEKIEAIV